MTAEIAIMNKRAIALAADSTVTIMSKDKAKFYNSANKLFMLSKYQPIGIMIYNNAEFMGIPWELIIKEYRAYIGDTAKDYVYEYADDFFLFLKSGNFMFKDYETKYYESTIKSFLRWIEEDILREYKQKINTKKNKLSEKEIISITTKIIDRIYKSFNKAKILDGVPDGIEEKLFEKYGKNLEKYIDDTIGLSALTQNSIDKLKSISKRLFFIDMFGEPCSGVVFAGFGKKDIFPSLFSYNVSGHIEGFLRKKLNEKESINTDKDFALIPFAQKDTVETFIYGVNNVYLRTLDEVFKKHIIKEIENTDDNIFTNSGKNIIKEKMNEKWKDVMNDIVNYSKAEYYAPIVRAVRVLPIDELASMAESLVNLTSFKRQVAMDENAHTVGGPIDVAVISKGDGFIWIKRKHYFKPELNHHFFSNYYKYRKEDEYEE